MRNIKVFILIYDITSYNSFDYINNWYKDSIEYFNDEVVFAVVANKMDLNEYKGVVNNEKAKVFADKIDPFLKEFIIIIYILYFGLFTYFFIIINYFHIAIICLFIMNNFFNFILNIKK